MRKLPHSFITYYHRIFALEGKLNNDQYRWSVSQGHKQEVFKEKKMLLLNIDIYDMLNRMPGKKIEAIFG